MIGNHYTYTQTVGSVTTAGNLYQIQMPAVATTPMAVAIVSMSFTLDGLASPNENVVWSIRTGSATDSNGTALTATASGDTAVDAGLVVDGWSITALTGGTVRYYDGGNAGVPIFYNPPEDQKLKFLGDAPKIHIQLVTAPSASVTIYSSLVLEVIEGM